ncbi:DUF1080 domain-containing protein [candidate division KSB1 bacterium]|nr:DUF1080 domain-containing protein [candidate division KSB1 bacterium]RQW05096.1 MAG: DUF1080 domain-containing protein [candidate division KSB1 bacterium]
MKNLFVILLVLSAFCHISTADEFIPLFNGVDLSGWVNVNCAPETWSVQNGMIHCTGLPTGVLRTESMYENYILELEYRHLEKEGNSGLFVHSDPLPVTGKPFTRAIEIQILTDRDTENYTSHGDVFAIQGASMAPWPLHPADWMRSLPQKQLANPTGEWNHYRVESREGTLTLAVNGEVVTRAYHVQPRKGYICLESEGGVVDFRNIRIQELPGTNPPPEVTAAAARGFTSLYNGVDLRGWKQVEGNEDHWQAKDWILAYDGQSEADGEDKHLWTEQEYVNFTLIVDWRLPAKPRVEKVPVVLPDGSTLKDETGEDLTIPVKNAGDSGIYLRGSSKSQINIWNWPVGSGEIYGYRTDASMPAEVRRATTPIQNADNPVNEWNRFEITVIDDTVTVLLNNKLVIDRATLPGMPKRGPIALQHHGDPLEFANIYIKRLK